jgi:hypothetical protein
MTARKAGEIAVEGLWGTLGRLRDRWILLVFAASALFWARDVYERFVDLPARVSELGRALDELRTDSARSDAEQIRPEVDRSAALAFPGLRHAIEDGRPGDLVTVALAPVVRVREECRNSDLAAFMIDADGRWYSVETDLDRVPQIEESQELAFGVKVHPRMDVGRAQFLVEVTQDCGSHDQVESSPRLHFRVLPR